MKQKSKETLIHARGVLDALHVFYLGEEVANMFSNLSHDIRCVLEDEKETESEAEECND